MKPRLQCVTAWFVQWSAVDLPDLYSPFGHPAQKKLFSALLQTPDLYVPAPHCLLLHSVPQLDPRHPMVHALHTHWPPDTTGSARPLQKLALVLPLHGLGGGVGGGDVGGSFSVLPKSTDSELAVNCGLNVTKDCRIFSTWPSEKYLKECGSLERTCARQHQVVEVA